MKYHLVSLGCQMNKSDSERIRTVLDGLGYAETDNDEEANLLGVVACSVRQKAIDRAYARIAKWNRDKQTRNLVTFISGCILPADKEQFLKKFDLVFSMAELPTLPEMISQFGVVTPVATQPGTVYAASKAAMEGLPTVDTRYTKENREILDNFWHIKPRYTSEFEAFVPIQNGCDKFCSFCAVPYTRGREVSRPSAEILAEVKDLVDRGYKSITLLGQNVNSYGLDKEEEPSFAGLLEEIGKLGEGHRFWVYFTSPHPRDMTDDVLEVMARYPVLAKQIHLPLQSGDDKVLIKMNRNHGLSRYREVVASIRRIIPEATLFTDIIVGFTGETDEQFERTRDAMREFRYNMAYIAQYSPRPGAASSRWEDDVPAAEKKRRLHELSKELQTLSREYNESLLDSEVDVLVEGHDRKEGYLSAKTEGRLIVRFASSGEDLIGQFVRVRITSAADLSLEGELVEAKVPTA